MKNPIHITLLLLFSIGFFVIGLLNWLEMNPNVDFSIRYINTLNNYHIFEICIIAGAIISVIQNYKRAKKRNPRRLFDAIFILFGLDFPIMLLGTFASQVVFLVFSFSNDFELQLFVGTYGLVVIIANILRKPILDFMTCQIH